MKYTIIVVTENKPGVLYRIADLFLRRKVNIEMLTVKEVDSVEHLSRFVIEVIVDTEDRADSIMKQIQRIIEVRHVTLVSGILMV